MYEQKAGRITHYKMQNKKQRTHNEQLNLARVRFSPMEKAKEKWKRAHNWNKHNQYLYKPNRTEMLQ